MTSKKIARLALLAAVVAAGVLSLGGVAAATTGFWATPAYGTRYAPQASVPNGCTNPDRTCTWVKSADNLLYYHKTDGTDVSVTGGGGGGTQGGTTTSTHVPYASGANTLADSPLIYTSGSTTFSTSGATVYDFSGSSGAFKTSSGTNTLSGAVSLAANVGITGTAGTGAVDFSAMTGTQRTTNGSFYFTNQLAFGAANFWLDAAGLNLTGGTNPVNVGSALAHAVGFSSSNVSPNGADKDLALGGAGNRRWNGLWNGGRLSGSYNTQSGTTYTIVAEDFYVGMSNSAVRTVTLPAANAVLAGHLYVIKDENGNAGTNNITINRAGADTIDGGTSIVINTNKGKVGLISNGSNAWFQVI